MFVLLQFILINMSCWTARQDRDCNVCNNFANGVFNCAGMQLDSKQHIQVEIRNLASCKIIKKFYLGKFYVEKMHFIRFMFVVTLRWFITKLLVIREHVRLSTIRDAMQVSANQLSKCVMLELGVRSEGSRSSYDVAKTKRVWIDSVHSDASRIPLGECEPATLLMIIISI